MAFEKIDFPTTLNFQTPQMPTFQKPSTSYYMGNMFNPGQVPANGKVSVTSGGGSNGSNQGEWGNDIQFGQNYQNVGNFNNQQLRAARDTGAQAIMSDGTVATLDAGASGRDARQFRRQVRRSWNDYDMKQDLGLISRPTGNVADAFMQARQSNPNASYYTFNKSVTPEVKPEDVTPEVKPENVTPQGNIPIGAATSTIQGISSKWNNINQAVFNAMSDEGKRNFGTSSTGTWTFDLDKLMSGQNSLNDVLNAGLKADGLLGKNTINALVSKGYLTQDAANNLINTYFKPVTPPTPPASKPEQPTQPTSNSNQPPASIIAQENPEPYYKSINKEDLYYKPTQPTQSPQSNISPQNIMSSTERSSWTDKSGTFLYSYGDYLINPYTRDVYDRNWFGGKSKNPLSLTEASAILSKLTQKNYKGGILKMKYFQAGGSINASKVQQEQQAQASSEMSEIFAWIAQSPKEALQALQQQGQDPNQVIKLIQSQAKSNPAAQEALYAIQQMGQMARNGARLEYFRKLKCGGKAKKKGCGGSVEKDQCGAKTKKCENGGDTPVVSEFKKMRCGGKSKKKC